MVRPSGRRMRAAPWTWMKNASTGSASVDELEPAAGERAGHDRRPVGMLGEPAGGLPARSGRTDRGPARSPGAISTRSSGVPVERHGEFGRRRQRARDLRLVVAGEEAAARWRRSPRTGGIRVSKKARAAPSIEDGQCGGALEDRGERRRVGAERRASSADARRATAAPRRKAANAAAWSSSSQPSKIGEGKRHRAARLRRRSLMFRPSPPRCASARCRLSRPIRSPPASSSDRATSSRARTSRCR